MHARRPAEYDSMQTLARRWVAARSLRTLAILHAKWLDSSYWANGGQRAREERREQFELVLGEDRLALFINPQSRVPARGPCTISLVMPTMRRAVGQGGQRRSVSEYLSMGMLTGPNVSFGPRHDDLSRVLFNPSLVTYCLYRTGLDNVWPQNDHHFYHHLALPLPPDRSVEGQEKRNP